MASIHVRCKIIHDDQNMPHCDAHLVDTCADCSAKRDSNLVPLNHTPGMLRILIQPSPSIVSTPALLLTAIDITAAPNCSSHICTIQQGGQISNQCSGSRQAHCLERMRGEIYMYMVDVSARLRRAWNPRSEYPSLSRLNIQRCVFI